MFFGEVGILKKRPTYYEMLAKGSNWSQQPVAVVERVGGERVSVPRAEKDVR